MHADRPYNDGPYAAEVSCPEDDLSGQHLLICQTSLGYKACRCQQYVLHLKLAHAVVPIWLRYEIGLLALV